MSERLTDDEEKVMRAFIGDPRIGAIGKPGVVKLLVLVDALRADLAATADRASREAQLACDLRSSQDQIIERCAKAVEEWPEAAARLRRHCGAEQDAEHAVSGEDFGELRRELIELNDAYKRTRLALGRAHSDLAAAQASQEAYCETLRSTMEDKYRQLREEFDRQLSTKERELAEAKGRAATLTLVLSRLRNGSCWCGVGIGNPMLSSHSGACLEAQAALKSTPEGE